MKKFQNSWRNKIISFFVSQSITLFGSQVVQMAIVWYVTLQTSSGSWIAAFSICSYLPQFLVTFPGGAWADRYDRKLLIIGADAGIAVITLGMFLLIPQISERDTLLRALLAMSGLRSIGAGIQFPAVNAVIPQIVPKESLMRYNSINAVLQSTVQFLSPAAAGVILTMGTLRFALLIDVFTAIIGIGIFGHILLPQKEEKIPSDSVYSDIREGIRYAFSRKMTGSLLMSYGIFTFLCVPAGYFSGLFVSRVYGGTYWYLTLTEVWGFGGMTAGGILMSILGNSCSGLKKRRNILFAGFIVFGIMSAGMGIVKSFAFYLIFMGIYGVALTTVQTTITTLIQEYTKSSIQGRILGFMGAMYAVCYPVGMAVFGLMADRILLQWIMIGSGIVLILVPVFLLKSFKS
ncbi:MFS transporter [Claveliimonas bilis]|uniref:MFS transporter n=1 Tax=Claveliimonas bilis TaxID=3028070 RepID=UPI001E5072C6|nr:MFS transporter [Claveliimonas bilis]BCZ27288.1 MFS transporter [Claveliimonas bilis]